MITFKMLSGSLLCISYTFHHLNTIAVGVCCSTVSLVGVVTSMLINFCFWFLSNIITVHCFPGKGLSQLSLADRATIANMSPEYGATMGFFPVDKVTLQYLRLTGRDEQKVSNFHDLRTDALLFAFCNRKSS